MMKTGIIWFLLGMFLAFPAISQQLPIIPPATTIVTQATNIRVLGAQCDGSSHPLSQYFPNNLAAAQAIYGSGVTLATEVDTAALTLAAQTSATQQWAGQGANVSAMSRNYGTWIITGLCRWNQTINLTGIQGPATFDFSGSVILCIVSGSYCADLSTSRNMWIKGLTLLGSCTATTGPTPSVGIFMARAGNPTTYNHFTQLKMDGCYTFAPFYNEQAEDTEIDNGTFSNGYNLQVSSGLSFGMVLDGQNWWNLCSVYVGSCTAQYNSGSFGQFTCIKCNILPTGNFVTPLYATDFKGALFSQFFATTAGETNSSVYEVLGELYNNYQFTNIRFDEGHFEGAVTNDFFFRSCSTTGSCQTGTTKQIPGFRWREHATNQSGSLIFLDPSITTLQFYDAELSVVNMQASTTWWNAPTEITLYGKVMTDVSAGTNWVAPSSPGASHGIFCTPACVYNP